MLKMNCLPRSTGDAQCDLIGLQNIIHIKQRDEVLSKLSWVCSLCLASIKFYLLVGRMDFLEALGHRLCFQGTLVY